MQKQVTKVASIITNKYSPTFKILPVSDAVAKIPISLELCVGPGLKTLVLLTITVLQTTDLYVVACSGCSTTATATATATLCVKKTHQL